MFLYAVTLRRDRNGGFVVTFKDIPEAITQGETEAEALAAARDALETALDFRPNVVLLDIGLPGLNGFEVARRLRQQPMLKNIMLVAMTGYGQESDRKRSREAGFDHHLVKPGDLRHQCQRLDLDPLQCVRRGH